MADMPRAQVVISDFSGLVLNSDPEDLPPGYAQTQLNATSIVPGELVVRAGYREVSFEAG